jgi:putative membrane protein
MTIRTVGLRIALLSALCSCTAVTFGAEAATSDGPPDPKAFLELAAQDGMTEVQLGELALRNSKNPQVRQFAQQMIDDHGKANTELMGIAHRKNVIAGKKLDAKHTALVHDLSAKFGTDFDAAYAKTMEDAHAKAIALFERESKGRDPELSSLAKQMLPVLMEHKHMADELNSIFH